MSEDEPRETAGVSSSGPLKDTLMIEEINLGGRARTLTCNLTTEKKVHRKDGAIIGSAHMGLQKHFSNHTFF